MSSKTRIAVSLCLLLCASGPAAAAEPSSHGTLTGVVRSGSDAPLAGARIFAGNPDTGEVFPSEPTGADGTFEIAGLPAAAYELAVASEEGLYLIEQPVALRSGGRQAVGISIAPGMATDEPEPGDDDEDDDGSAAPLPVSHRPNIWNNPLTAALLVLGVAVIFGVMIESATDDDDSSDDFEPPTSPLEI